MAAPICCFVRGGFDVLLAQDLSAEARLAVEQARLYHQAAAMRNSRASSRPAATTTSSRARRPRGERRSGVLEQSWRLGGATGAEIAALEVVPRPSRNCTRVHTA